MASLIAQHLNPGGIEIYITRNSYDAVDHLLERVMDEINIKPSQDAISQIDDIHAQNYDLVIVLCKCLRHRLLYFSRSPALLYWPLDNPVKKGLSPNQIFSQLRKTRDELLSRIQHLFSDGYLDAFQHQNLAWRDIFNDPSRGSLLFNRDEIISDANEKACSLTGFSMKELCGKPLHFLLPDDMVSRHAMAVLESDSQHREAKLKLMLHNRSIMQVSTSLCGLSNSNGQAGMLSFTEERDQPTVEAAEEGGGIADRLSPERVEAALRQSDGNRTKASQLLGVGRATLYRFLEKRKIGDSSKARLGD